MHCKQAESFWEIKSNRICTTVLSTSFHLQKMPLCVYTFKKQIILQHKDASFTLLIPIGIRLSFPSQLEKSKMKF